MLNLSEKHGMIRMIAEKIANEKVAPRAKEIDSTGAFPWDLVDVFKKQIELALHTVHLGFTKKSRHECRIHFQ